MKPIPSSIDQGLERARRRWKWLRSVRDSSIWGAISCAALMGLGAAVRIGVLHRHARSALLVLGATAVLGEGAVLASVWRTRTRGRWLAAAVERVDRRLQDRLNTWLFLENRTGEPWGVFRSRIGQQIHQLLQQRAPPSPFSFRPALAWLATFLVLLGIAASLNHLYAPWAFLRPGARLRPASAAAVGRPVKLPTPDPLATPPVWGEVRITHPGSDLRVTKVDVVPLTIEAAANRDLKSVTWYSSVNGNPEQSHTLPVARDPRCAVYKPVLYLDQFELSDWDVLTYFAKAQTDATNVFSSQVYFLEVRPFREDILKLPGGEAGRPYRTLGDITSLISRQQQVIRHTYQLPSLVSSPLPSVNPAHQQLAGQEFELSKAAEHLYAQMATGMENQPIAPALDKLAAAETSLGEAGRLLLTNSLTKACERERGALAELVASRKIFQQAVTDHPQNFAGPERPPSAGVDASQRLNQMAEFRDEAKSGREYVQKLLEEQEQFERERAGGNLPASAAAQREQDLERELKDFSAQHPDSFQGARPLSEQAQAALARAGEQLHASRPTAAAAVHEATAQLQNLRAGMERLSGPQRLADAYRLKQLLEQQIRHLQNLTHSPGEISQADAAASAEAARKLVDELKRNLEAGTNYNGFGQPLLQALAGQNTNSLDQKLSELQHAGDPLPRLQAAVQATQSLQDLAEAFGSSLPAPLQAARAHDALRADPGTGLSQALSQLESLLQRLEHGRALASSDQQKQARQALGNLEAGLRGQPDQDGRGQALVDRLEAMVSQGQGMDRASLKRLLEQLDRLSLELQPKLAGQPDSPLLSNPDLTRFPPNYRDRIQRYFQRLSEQ